MRAAIGGRPPVRYRSPVFDSARWEGFAFRDGDIVISTPAKCGTTWMQMICALLVFRTGDLPRHLSLLSPWIDALARDRDSVLDALAAQRHRRFVKTHTPLDGLPFDGRVTYVCVGRDPRDVGLSTGHHLANLDMEAVARAHAAAGGTTDLDALAHRHHQARRSSESEHFRRWATDPTPPDWGPLSLHGTLHHLDTFWSRRTRDNIVLVHYDDLRADLPGSMRRLADRLAIPVDDAHLARLAEAAAFTRMRARADQYAAESDLAVWRDNRTFFRRGGSGQWRTALTPDDLRLYRQRAAQLAGPGLRAWLHRESEDPAPSREHPRD